MRLQKFLARAGVASRRGSENLMTAGRIKVNGQVVTELGSKVDPLKDSVEVDGVPVKWGEDPVYLMLNKPAGFVTTMRDPQDRPCVASLVPTDKHPGLFPVGRLDRATCGLLLFTTNGEVGNVLLHPRHHVDKTYVALLSGSVTEHTRLSLERGVELRDGLTAPAQVEMLDERALQVYMKELPARLRQGNVCLLRITIHEGRNRQVRRMCSAVGHECLYLRRIKFGPLELDTLQEGSWRYLSPSETRAIEQAASKQC